MTLIKIEIETKKDIFLKDNLGSIIAKYAQQYSHLFKDYIYLSVILYNLNILNN